jgi:glycosyltransferase involved in cell wall biosynthesis
LANNVLVFCEKMKIVYLIPCCGVSGGIAVICQHANRLLKRGHDVLFVTETDERSIDWFPGQSVPIVGMDEYPVEVDILVATGWSTSFRVAILPARRKFYFVQSDETRFHAPDSPWEHITRLSYTIGFNYLTEARWIKAWLLNHFGQDAELVPNGLDETFFFPSEPLEPKNPEKPRILLEGAIGLPYKGMAVAFEAVKDLDVDIWCVSTFGQPEEHWRCDRFFEQVPMMEMRRIYSSCDILLKLSRVEGFFGPPMEMMACGGAVVVGEVTGYDEYIENEVNALVVDPLQPMQAASAIRRLIDDRSLRERLIENGRQTAQQWRWEPSIDILERYYLDVLEGRRGAVMTEGETAVASSIAYVYRQFRGEEGLYWLPKPEPEAKLELKAPEITTTTEDPRFSSSSVNRTGRALWALLKSPARVRRAISLSFPFIIRAMRNPCHGVRAGKMVLSIFRVSGLHGLKQAMVSQNEKR